MGKVATESTLTNILSAVKTIGEYTKYIAVQDDMIFVLQLQRGADYKETMRAFFHAHNGDSLDDLSELCDRWYTITRPGWHGGVRFPRPRDGAAASSDGTKTGDNAGLVCVPSTTTEANQDDYANNPLFACVDCNAYVDEAGKPHVTAIDGVAGEFERYNPEKIVAVMQMTGWIKGVEESDVYGFDYTDEPGLYGYQPLPEAVELADNSVRPWVVHGKYGFGGMSSTDGYACCSGMRTHVFNVSHNTQLTGVRNAWGNQYCGLTSADDAFIKRMLYLKYGQLDSDRILQGCLDYNYSYQIAVAETDVERVIITTAQAANLVVGSTVSVGTVSRVWNTNDRAVCDFVKITKIENVTIDGASYAAVYVDNGGAKFNTATTNYVITYQWYTGSTDAVMGNDGGINPKSAKYAAKIQGIELMIGCSETFGDTILRYETENDVKVQRAHICRDASKLSTSVTSDYKAASYAFPAPNSSGWQYPKRMGYDANLPEVMLGSVAGGSSTTGPRDGYYIEAKTTADGALREGLRFGTLSFGLALGGASYLHGRIGLTTAYGNIGGRLSVTGNRGEFSA